MTKFRLMLAAAAAVLAVAPAAGASELLTNGDFEAGNVGFHSDYTYMVGNFWGEGTYGVDDDPNDGHNLFSSYGDHTSGEGLMMVVNGMGTENAVVWGEDTFNVLQNSDYTFSFWMASAHPDSPAQLAARINGDWLSPVAAATSTTGQWTQYSYTWNSGSAVSANVELINRNLAWQGNDFTLDDVSFNGAAVPEPSMWALMIMGFGTAGAMLRRRKMVPFAIRA
jgi:hypothetical protein